MAKTTKAPRQKEVEVINNEVIREGLGSLYDNQIVTEPAPASEEQVNTNTSITPPSTEDIDQSQSEPSSTESDDRQETPVNENEPDDNDTQPEPQAVNPTPIIPATPDFIRNTFYEVAKTKTNTLSLLLNLNDIKSRSGKVTTTAYDSNDTVRIIENIFAKANNEPYVITSDEISFVMTYIGYDDIRHAGTLMGTESPKYSCSYIRGCSSISAKSTVNTSTTTNTTTPTGANVSVSYGPVNITVTNPVSNTGTINPAPCNSDARNISTIGIKDANKMAIPIEVQNELSSSDREAFRGLRLSDTAAGKPIAKC